MVAIGGSFTGVSLTSDVSLYASEIIHSFRRPFFVVKHYMEIEDEKESKKIPVDFFFYTRNYLRSTGKEYDP